MDKGHRDQLSGAGLGLRSEFLNQFRHQPADNVSFLEIAPENWLGIGGQRAKQLQYFSERYPILAHGLSLSLGGPAALNESFLHQLKSFFARYDIAIYSEHLSYCTDQKSYLYDLMPIPFTFEAVMYVAQRINRAQDLLERKIAIENVSYYFAPGQEMSELEFINAVLSEADCNLLLDINNIYVNSINHHYDPYDFLAKLPHDRVSYLHVAGHYRQQEDLAIDTHGESVVDDVWDLLAHCYRCHAVYPTLLERDNDIPPLDELLAEVARINMLQADHRERLYG